MCIMSTLEMNVAKLYLKFWEKKINHLFFHRNYSTKTYRKARAV